MASFAAIFQSQAPQDPLPGDAGLVLKELFVFARFEI